MSGLILIETQEMYCQVTFSSSRNWGINVQQLSSQLVVCTQLTIIKIENCNFFCYF